MKIDPASFTLLDGPLLPNDAIENAESLKLDAPDDLAVAADGALLVSEGISVLRVAKSTKAKPATVATFGGRVTALCALPDSRMAVAVEGEGLYMAAQTGGDVHPISDAEQLRHAVTACTASGDAIVLTKATRSPGKYPYTHELFAQKPTGQLLRVDMGGKCETVLDGLRGPHGVATAPTGEIVISETWAAGMNVLSPDGNSRTVLSGFAGYPGRLSPLKGGGFLLACLSRRDPLVDFVRTEPLFAGRMMRELDPCHWVAPRLHSNVDVNVPTQSGATRLFGEIKPWAPSLSYGLICELDDNFVPRTGYHSRANGVRHGIVSAVEWDGKLAAISKATNELLFIDMTGRQDD